VPQQQDIAVSIIKIVMQQPSIIMPERVSPNGISVIQVGD
jgi:hypothetical protein